MHAVCSNLTCNPKCSVQLKCAQRAKYPFLGLSTQGLEPSEKLNVLFKHILYRETEAYRWAGPADPFTVAVFYNFGKSWLSFNEPSACRSPTTHMPHV